MLSWTEWNLNLLKKEPSRYYAHNRISRKQMYRTYTMDCPKDCIRTKINIPNINGGMHSYSLDCCKPAAVPSWPVAVPDIYYQEQGNNPMRIETNSATAVVSAVRSDEAIQRDYLMAEFSRLAAYDPKFGELRELFNIDAPKYPKDTQTLIDAFKDGKIVIDQAKVDANTKLLSGEGGRSYDDADDYVGGRFYGLTFTALPTPDYKGWEAAKEAYEALKTATKRKIIVGSPADGLAALEAFEAWTPAQNAPTTATVQ